MFRLIRTGLHPCPYFLDREAIYEIFWSEYGHYAKFYNALTQKGFRRSADELYRTACPNCSDCVSTRIPVNQFKPNRSQRRNIKANSDLVVKIQTEGFQGCYESLYLKYIHKRHPGGNMDTGSTREFQEYYYTQWYNTTSIEFWLDEQLVAVSVTDILEDGLSLLYCFYDPDYISRGLGTYAILWQIQYARDNNLPYVFPGFWIAGTRKMNYKAAFQPIEGLQKGRWDRFKKSKSQK